MSRSPTLEPHWPERLRTAAASRRRGGRRRRVLRRALSVVLLIAAGVVAVTDPRGGQPGLPVVAVRRDLPTGSGLAAADLVTVAVPELPDGAVRRSADAVGRVLSGPVRKGELLTDVRLVPIGGWVAGPGRVAVPVRPADPGTADLLNTGVHVAVLAVAENGSSTVLATDAVVLAIPPPATSDSGKRLVVLAVPAAAADRITATAITGSIALRFT